MCAASRLAAGGAAAGPQWPGRVLLGLLAAVVLAACSPSPAPASAAAPASVAGTSAPRYLYVVHCDARVDKLDLAERKVVASFGLAERSGSPAAVASAPDGKMDGCLTQRTLADREGQTVSLLAPRSARLDSDGLQDFQVLRFALPDWRLIATQAAGRRPEAPWLQQAVDGSVRLLDDNELTPVTTLDLTGFAGRPVDAGGLILASSGPGVLLSLLTPRPTGLVLALADRHARTMAMLQPVPPTNIAHVHLAPGGSHVLVEATASAERDAQATGALHLYDASGRRVRDWQDDAVKEAVLVALTPQGDLVYRTTGGYRFIATGLSFGNTTVTRPMPKLADPGLVFSER